MTSAFERPRAWQAVLYATNPVVHELWHLLGQSDRKQFKEKYLSAFLSSRVSIPLENAEKLLSYLESGQLEFIVGCDHVTKDSDGRVLVEHTEPSGKQTHSYAFGIWATGFPQNLENSGSSLLTSMLLNGDITRHPDGGITVDRRTYQVIRSDSSADSQIFAVGEITSGQFFFTSVLDIICRHAKLCAESFHKIVRMSELEAVSMTCSPETHSI
ncbi:hypothetical protein [Halothiobacillus sp.]|uniref:hypothetical protein n=1 Tax=Halothiobacillus sp. TaxID=1891311 RepID=UPI00261B86DA|nr:hypothetical protein [Halothiobacillus sp.]MDD4965755.1 hypothetical protein [Halothiobacillus sp.]